MLERRLSCPLPPRKSAPRVKAGSRWLPSTKAKGSDEMTDELITRLAAANPVPHDGPLYVAEPVRVRPTWKVVPGVVVAMAALRGAGVAIADCLGGFKVISYVQHPQTTGDVIDPSTAAYIEGKNCDGPGEPVCHGVVAPQFDTARHLGQLPNGQSIYVLGCAQTYLCTV